MRYRFATPSDAAQLVALVESAYRGEDSRQGWTTEADLLDGRRTGIDDVLACIDDPAGGLLLAEDEGRVLACVNISRQDGAGYFGMFAVEPSLQGRGIGSELMREAERVVRDVWSQAQMRMTVIDVRDELIDYYRRRGYHRTGIHKPFPYGDERFGIPRRDDLRFEILEKDLTA